MKILFLDFDGVLNSIASCIALGGYDRFSPVCVGLVERLVQLSNAKIVISSSWRIGRNQAGLLDDMRRAGAQALVPYVVGMTPVLSGFRGEEIQQYLDTSACNAESYVILDDDSDMLPGQPLVKTNIVHGFTLNEYTQALSILAPGHEKLSQLNQLHMQEGVQT